MGWVDDGEECGKGCVPDGLSENPRANFYMDCGVFVEAQVNDRMKELLKFEFNGESIWGRLGDQSRII